jgi:hypothetical protein
VPINPKMFSPSELLLHPSLTRFHIHILRFMHAYQRTNWISTIELFVQLHAQSTVVDNFLNLLIWSGWTFAFVWNMSVCGEPSRTLSIMRLSAVFWASLNFNYQKGRKKIAFSEFPAETLKSPIPTHSKLKAIGLVEYAN